MSWLRAATRRCQFLYISSAHTTTPSSFRPSGFCRHHIVVPSRFQQTGSNSSNGNFNKNAQDPKEQARLRRAYALGGCLMFMWIGTHAILLYRRRSEFRSLNEKIPPIEWSKFVEEHLLKGDVKTIVFQTQFGVANVYLHSAKEQLMKKTVLDVFHATPDKFTRPPDVRFVFDRDQAELESTIKSLQAQYPESRLATNGVEISIDQFPSYRELSFIIASTIFTLAAVTLIK